MDDEEKVADLNHAAWKTGIETGVSASEAAETMSDLAKAGVEFIPFTFQDPDDFGRDFNYELIQENARLRKALEFYAQESSYKKMIYSGIKKVKLIEYDRGRTARKELGWNNDKPGCVGRQINKRS